MPKSIPTNGQTNWGTALNDHIGQLMDPTNGGFNIVENVAARNARFASVAANEGATVYNKETGTFQVLESGAYTGVRWTDLGRTMSGNAQIGAGTLTYGINNAGNPSAGDFYQYLQSSDNNLETYVKTGDYIKPNGRTDYLYLVGDKIAANKFKISVALDERPENNVTGGPNYTVSVGTRDVTISIANYVQVGDTIGNATWGPAPFITEKISGTSYRTTGNSPITYTTVINILRRPITNFSQWEVFKVTFNVNDQLLVNPNKTITLKGGRLVNEASPSLTEKVYRASQMGSAGSSSAIAVATGTKGSGINGINVTASVGKGNGLNNALSSADADWAGELGSIYGVEVNTIQNASPSTVTDSMASFMSTAYITKGKVKSVAGVFLNTTAMMQATASEVQLPDNVWGIYQTNDVRGPLGYKMAKNMFQGNVLIKSTQQGGLYEADQYYAEADQRLVVDGATKIKNGGLSLVDTYGIILNKSTATTNEKYWDIQVDTGNSFTIRALNDAYNGVIAQMVFTRTGNLSIGGTLTQNSDETLKKDIVSLKDSLSVVSKLRGVNYFWKDENRETSKQVGFIAQEVEKVLPEVVHTNEDGIKSLAYQNMVPVLVEAIKELKAEIDELKKKVA